MLGLPYADRVISSSCRFCGRALEHVFVDLGMAPLANAYVAPDRISAPEPFFPLRALVCASCFLVQVDEFETPEHVFADYAYFSSYSSTWLEHAARYTAEMVEQFGIGCESKVVEVASNDGYLLQYFVERGVPVLGIEPAANVAAAAVGRGVPTEIRFFGRDAAADLRANHTADLLIVNNVLAHVPDLNDFVAGLALLLKPNGVITLEFPHLMKLVDEVQFDTIYHEHLCYFSFSTASRVLAAQGLTVFDVEELPTHGGSLRVYARHRDDDSKAVRPRVAELRGREREAGYERIETYIAFAERVPRDKRQILEVLIAAKERGASIAGYGAPAKGNTLLNYCGIGTDFVDYTVDRNPHKQGQLLPGSRIPILPPEEIDRTRPDLLFILPWNIKDEVMAQMAHVREWGAQFVVRTPELRLCP
jgi:SAM-dependent methyltransferase